MLSSRHLSEESDIYLSGLFAVRLGLLDASILAEANDLCIPDRITTVESVPRSPCTSQPSMESTRFVNAWCLVKCNDTSELGLQVCSMVPRKSYLIPQLPSHISSVLQVVSKIGIDTLFHQNQQVCFESDG